MTCALRPVGVGVGHPRPLRCSGPTVPWVSLPGSTGVPKQKWHRVQNANNLWLCCSGPMMWTSCILQEFVGIDTSF